MFKTDIAFKSDINKNFLPFVTAFMVFIASIIFATRTFRFFGTVARLLVEFLLFILKTDLIAEINYKI